ncbi:MAG: response regulator [Desulfobacterales bacterium]|nr:response regulator [Desulfobacterales bacterium]
MTKIKVLIIDDEMEFATTLAERLDLRDYESKAVESADQAFVLFQTGWTPEVIILDLKMPGVDGLATLAMIKQHNPAIEVIMLTGHGSTASGIEGMRRGLFDYLMKPVDINELVEKINEAANKHGP